MASKGVLSGSGPSIAAAVGGSEEELEGLRMHFSPEIEESSEECAGRED